MKLYKLGQLLGLTGEQYLSQSLIIIPNVERLIYISKQAHMLNLMGKLVLKEGMRTSHMVKMECPAILTIPYNYKEMGHRFFWCQDCHMDGSKVQGIIIY